MPYVKEMIEAHGGSVKANSAFRLPEDDEPFLQSLGQGLDKIRVVGRAQFADDDTAAALNVRQEPDARSVRHLGDRGKGRRAKDGGSDK